jgi:hypothetical protein
MGEDCVDFDRIGSSSLPRWASLLIHLFLRIFRIFECMPSTKIGILSPLFIEDMDKKANTASSPLSSLVKMGDVSAISLRSSSMKMAIPRPNRHSLTAYER